MVKIHTRRKRRLGISTHKSGVVKTRISRPKTFKTEESAKKYAESNGIKKYELVNIKGEFSKVKKIKIVTN